jgi:hypothetical protein
MKKAIPWIVSIILILIGISNSANSIVAGLPAVIAGLLFMPPVIKMLASKKQFMFLTKKTWSIKVIAAVLVAITFGLASDAQNEKLIASYNADPTKVLNEAKQALEQKDFVIAKNRIEKYLKALPNNPELTTLMAQINSEKAEVEKQAELKKEQAKVNTTSSESVELSDPDAAGRCMGFLAMLAFKEGNGKWTQGNISYVQSNKLTMNKILKIDKETKSCPTRYEDIRPCLSDYNDYEKQLYIGYLTGGNNYALAKAEGEFKIEFLQLACEN